MPLQVNDKLRPIALAEGLLKIVEAGVMAESNGQLLSALEPIQLGAGSPDGVVLTVKLLQAWADQMSRTESAFTEEFVRNIADNDTALETNLQAIAPLDLVNAYGKFFRGPALEQAIAHVPMLAAFAATEWSTLSSSYWQ
eukprot:670944-Karenia_brevis.AAC.1